ncbi:MAG: hypothetical protein ABFS41_05105 [Myxococcota bacterium]
MPFRRIRWIGLAALIAIAGAPAAAVTISNLSVSDASTSFFDDTGPVGSVAQSGTNVVSSNAAGFAVDYDAVVGADTGGAGGGTFTQLFGGSFTITFEVAETAGVAWSVGVDVVREGALTIVSDGTGSAEVTLGALTVWHAGAGSLVGSLDLAAVATLDNVAAAGTSPDQPFSQSSAAVLSGIGTGTPQLVSLAFSFTASATTRDLAGGMVQGDEGALRLGAESALASFSADDYPGPGGRSLAGDGIQVTAAIPALPVPEPGAEALLALSLIGLAWSERRRDRRVRS